MWASVVVLWASGCASIGADTGFAFDGKTSGSAPPDSEDESDPPGDGSGSGPQATTYCVGDYSPGANPESGCCVDLKPNPGVTCSASVEAEPPQSVTVTCEDGTGEVTTVTLTVTGGDPSDSTTWTCSHEVTDTEGSGSGPDADP